jgi:hypothetical protein
MNVKGQEVTRRYFFQWGLPFLKSRHGHLVDKLAAGMIGGSDSIGADDEISRDHNWGPGFSIWLTEEDFSCEGGALAADLHEAVPDTFEGYEVAACFGSKEKSIRVRAMDEFFMEETGGHKEMPADVAKWNPTPRDESHLYFLKHGHIFHDPLGEFTRRVHTFCTWPRHELLRRIGNALWQLWHYGQYNFARVAKREDPLAVLFCKSNFVHNAMRLCFYLEEDFVPYWKWTSYCFRQIDGIGEVAAMLDRFHEETDFQMQTSLIESICTCLCSRVIEKGYVAARDVEEVSPLGLYNRLEQMSEELLKGMST